jgi:ribonuclease R
MDEKILGDRKQAVLGVLKSKEYLPMKTKELAILFGIPKDRRNELQYVLDELMNEGRISMSKKGKYAIASSDIVVGTFEGNRRGFGFVTVEGEEEDIFIPERAMNGAINKDLVQVAIRKNSKHGSKSKEGEIVKVLSHGTEEVVGIYQKSKNFGFVIADNQKFNRDIFVPAEKSKGAVTGHKVVVKITDFGS